MGAPSHLATLATKAWRTQNRAFGALARWPGWLEHFSIYQMVACSIPGQGTELGCRAIPDRGICGRQPIDLSKIDKHIFRWGFKKKKKEEEETELWELNQGQYKPQISHRNLKIQLGIILCLKCTVLNWVKHHPKHPIMLTTRGGTQ